MFVNRLMNGGNAPLLEQMVRFTSKRHELIAENIANIDTPFYQQKDYDLDKFQAQLQQRVADRKGKPVGSVRFSDIQPQAEAPEDRLLFHDGNNRSAEQLMTDLSKNALSHNLYIELFKRQFTSIETALKERVS